MSDISVIAIASDHAGFALKTHLVGVLKERGLKVRDHGPTSADRVDYPDFADLVAKDVDAGEVARGILVCGSGIGMSMRANRYRNVRAANCVMAMQAEATRAHNDANILCLGERIVGVGLAERITIAFLDTAFEGGRHAQRVAKLGK